MDDDKYLVMAYAMIGFFIILMLFIWGLTLSLSLLTTRKYRASTRSIVHSVLGLLLPAAGILFDSLPSHTNYPLSPQWQNIYSELLSLAPIWITLSLPCSLASLFFTVKALKTENGRAKQTVCGILTGLCTALWVFLTVSYFLYYQ